MFYVFKLYVQLLWWLQYSINEYILKYSDTVVENRNFSTASVFGAPVWCGRIGNFTKIFGVSKLQPVVYKTALVSYHF